MAEDKDRRLSTRDIAGAASDERQARASAAVEEPRVAPASVSEEATASEAAAPLFAPDETNGYRARWDAIQTGFVDEPRRAVEEADALVADLMKRLAEGFAPTSASPRSPP